MSDDGDADSLATTRREQVHDTRCLWEKKNLAQGCGTAINKSSVRALVGLTRFTSV